MFVILSDTNNDLINILKAVVLEIVAKQCDLLKCSLYHI